MLPTTRPSCGGVSADHTNAPMKMVQTSNNKSIGTQALAKTRLDVGQRVRRAVFHLHRALHNGRAAGAQPRPCGNTRLGAKEPVYRS
jgi:hypothetical protein